MEHPDFLLFPTLFHQQRDSIVPSAQKCFDAISPFFPPPSLVRLEYWAHTVEWRRLESFENVKRLAGQHIWRDEVLADRFDWGREQGIYAIVVRVFKLGTAIELPMLPEYRGCKSWVQVAHPAPEMGSAPVLNDQSFARKVSDFHDACDCPDTSVKKQFPSS